MKRTYAGLALGFVLSLPATPAVFAAQSVTTPAFTLTYLEGLFSPTGSITLVDQSPGAYSFALDTLNADLAGAQAYDIAGSGAVEQSAHGSLLGIDINPGYRVTGLVLSFATAGELTPGQVAGFPPGIVSNGAGLFMGVWASGTYQPFGNQYADFGAQENWELGSSALAPGEVTRISFNGWLKAEAFGVDGGGETAPSYAFAAIRDAVLRVEVSPVPEPATWAMLLGGLLLSGIVARRR